MGLNWMRCHLRVAAAIAALTALGIGFVAGAVAGVMAVAGDRVEARLTAMIALPAPRPDAVALDWRRIDTNLMTLERAEAPIGDVDGSATGGAIERFGSNIIYASANGHLAAMDVVNGTITYFDVRVPMDYERLRNDVFAAHSAFNQNWYRVHDLLVVPTSQTTADLFVSHHKFDDATNTMCTVVNRTEITLVDKAVTFPHDHWSEVYRIKGCLHLPDFNWSFDGHMSGGRMVQLDENHILLSVGDFAMAEFHDRPEDVVADSGNDLAKIIEINLETGESAPYAFGVRNPQGLAFDAHGNLWETEHAAKGGDELNFILPGEHYGWPHVGLGSAYGNRPTRLPLSDRLGSHDGYRMPAFSFVPSIGISNLMPVKPSAGFDLWEGDLLILSLVAETVFRVRPDGARGVYAEPIPLGSRLRDIVELEGGGYGILTTDRTIIFLRDAARAVEPVNAGRVMASSISGYDAVASVEQAARSSVIKYSWGQDMFRGKCASCHMLNGETHAGPPLNGIVGAKVGSLKDYPYSLGLQKVSGRWTRQRLERFIRNPQSVFPGAAMGPDDSMDQYEMKALLDYLAETER